MIAVRDRGTNSILGFLSTGTYPDYRNLFNFSSHHRATGYNSSRLLRILVLFQNPGSINLEIESLYSGTNSTNSKSSTNELVDYFFLSVAFPGKCRGRSLFFVSYVSKSIGIFLWCIVKCILAISQQRLVLERKERVYQISNSCVQMTSIPFSSKSNTRWSINSLST